MKVMAIVIVLLLAVSTAMAASDNSASKTTSTATATSDFTLAIGDYPVKSTSTATSVNKAIVTKGIIVEISRSHAVSKTDGSIPDIESGASAEGSAGDAATSVDVSSSTNTGNGAVVATDVDTHLIRYCPPIDITVISDASATLEDSSADAYASAGMGGTAQATSSNEADDSYGQMTASSQAFAFDVSSAEATSANIATNSQGVQTAVSNADAIDGASAEATSATTATNSQGIQNTMSNAFAFGEGSLAEATSTDIGTDSTGIAQGAESNAQAYGIDSLAEATSTNTATDTSITTDQDANSLAVDMWGRITTEADPNTYTDPTSAVAVATNSLP